MKLYLILVALASCTVCYAQGVTGRAPRLPQPKPQPVQVSGPPSEALPRHLSDAERAELRRQLREFNRHYSKSS